MSTRVAEEIQIPTAHLRLSAKRWGAEGGLPVLALHGWLDNASTFDRLAPLLPRLDLVSLDLPGHGRSEHRPAGSRYHYTDYVDEVMAAADLLGWPRFILLGHSMGAGIGCLVAAAYPQRVARLILIESLGPVTGALREVSAQLQRSVEAMKPEPSQNSKTPAYHDLEVLIRARAAAGDLARDSAEILVRRSVERQGAVFKWRSDKRLRRPFPQYFANAVVLAFLRAIRAPVLLIVAKAGILRKRPYYQSRRKAIGDLRLVSLPGHHHLHLDTPEPVAEAINAFLPSDKEIANGI